MSSKNKTPRKGRPRAFDEAEVLLRAQQTFLRHGYEGVSYEQIATAMGLSKPSLYNAFGDKDALFDRVLRDYAEMAFVGITSSVQSQPDIKTAASALLQGAAAIYSSPDDKSVGCLLIGTSLPACAVNDQVQEILDAFITKLDLAFAKTLAAEHADELRQRGQSAAQMAKLFSGLLFSIAIRARAGMTSRALQKLADELAELAA